MGKEIESEEDTTIVTSYTIGKRGKDASLPIEERIESFRLANSLPDGTNATTDSSDHRFKTNDPELGFLGDVFKLINETAYTIVLDGKNKVKAIEGSDVTE